VAEDRIEWMSSRALRRNSGRTTGRAAERAGRLRGVGVWVSAALLLPAAGCGQANPSVVAYVGPVEISQRQLDAAVAAVNESLGDQGGQATPEDLANIMVHGALAEQVARDHRIALTDAKRDALVGGSQLAPLLDEPVSRQVAYDLADAELVSQVLGAEAYQGEVAKRRVTLNPRFGVLDPARKVIVENSSGSLSRPAGGPGDAAQQ
jgi:hypothetical protein